MARHQSPRQRISVVCPHCGHQQEEPQQVLSSYCRRCRSHFEVANGKVVVSAQKDTPAFGLPPDQRPDPPPPTPRPAGPPIRVHKEEDLEQPEPSPPPGPPIRTRKEEDLEQPEPSPPPGPPIRTRKEEDLEQPVKTPPPGPPIRTFKEQQAELDFDQPPSGPPVRTRPEDEPNVEAPRAAGPVIRTRSESDPIPGAWSADPPPERSKGPSPLAQLRERIRPKPPQRSVLCDACGCECSAPSIANATNCPDCGAWLNLADFEINEPWGEPISTRGDVVIQRKGLVTDTGIECHNLLVTGHLEGGARCTGTLTIRRSGMIRGKISCGELRVERRARVQFIHPVDTGLAVINGQVIGSIRARSTVTLMRKSRITGNVAATELVMKRGAQHIGKFRLSEAAAAAPESTAATPETAD